MQHVRTYRIESRRPRRTRGLSTHSCRAVVRARSGPIAHTRRTTRLGRCESTVAFRVGTRLRRETAAFRAVVVTRPACCRTVGVATHAVGAEPARALCLSGRTRVAGGTKALNTQKLCAHENGINVARCVDKVRRGCRERGGHVLCCCVGVVRGAAHRGWRDHVVAELDAQRDGLVYCCDTCVCRYVYVCVCVRAPA